LHSTSSFHFALVKDHQVLLEAVLRQEDANGSVLEAKDNAALYFWAPGSSVSKIFVRKAYQDLIDYHLRLDVKWKSIEERFPPPEQQTKVLQQQQEAPQQPFSDPACCVLLTGTPGVGKSLFAVYLVWYVLQHHLKFAHIVRLFYRRLTQRKIVWYCFVRDYNNHWVASPHEMKPDENRECVDQLLVLDDSNANALLGTYDFCYNVWITSPKSIQLKPLVKEGLPKTIIMPIWTREELDVAVTKLGFAVDVKNCYAIAGGCPRMIFGYPTKEDCMAIMEQELTLKHDDYATLWNLVSSSHASLKLYSESQAVAALIHIPCGPTNGYQLLKTEVLPLQFASNYVRHELSRHLIEVWKNGINTMAVTYITGGARSGMAGELSEECLHSLIASGGLVFDAIDLADSTKRYKVQMIKWPTHTMYSRDLDEALKEIVQDGVYYLPDSKHFPVVDALVRPRLAFQMTISQNHPPKLKPLLKIMQTLMGVSGKRGLFSPSITRIVCLRVVVLFQCKDVQNVMMIFPSPVKLAAVQLLQPQ